MFASEFKPFRQVPGFQGDIDRDALAGYVGSGYVPAPRSIYLGVHKVPPGTIVDLASTTADSTPRRYWSLAAVATCGLVRPFTGSANEAVDELERLLLEAVRGQMIADVPLGAFLSGRIDASTVVALMQRLSPGRVKTYTIGFDEAAYNEAHHARAVAAHLQTEHAEWTARRKDALALVRKLAEIYDEPIADMSQIPTLMVSHLARRDVTVAATGDAGDELFCGYGCYPQALATWKRLARLPPPLRRLARRILPPGRLRVGIASRDVGELYRYMNRQWKESPGLVLGRRLPARQVWQSQLDPTAGMMFVDTLEYLPDDILIKVERTAMVVSLESRVSMLDHRIIEFAFSLRTHVKRREGVGKWPLSRILYRHVPKELVDRPKEVLGARVEAWPPGPARAGWQVYRSRVLLRSRCCSPRLTSTSIQAGWAPENC